MRPPRWRCRRPSRRACTCISGSDHQCRRKWRFEALDLPHSCPKCERSFPTTLGLAVHRARWCRAGQRPASRRGQLADKAIKLAKRKTSATLLPPVVMEGDSLESVYQFDYLGCRFTSDGDDAADMRHRMAIAGERSRGLDHLWRDNRLPRSLKMRLYAAIVCSTLMHGSEACMLTHKSAGNAQRLQLPATAPHHREIVSRGCHQAFVRPSEGCADAEASLAGTYPADACRPPNASCGDVAGLGQRAGPPCQPASLLTDTPHPIHELVLRAADRRGWARDGRSLSSL